MLQSADLLVPLYELMHGCLVQQAFLQGDETPTQVLKEKGRTASQKSYMWVARTPRKAPLPLVYFAYAPGRTKEIANNLYAGFKGVLQCDGYAGYNDLEVQRVGCWAHVRRKFFEAARVAKTLDDCIPLKLLNQMFHLEEQWKALVPRARQRKRYSKMKRILKRFWEWCDTCDALPKSGFGKAVSYAQGMCPYLKALLDVGELDWSNNAAERNMKSYVMGRKNFLFSTSPEGAKANAILMSIIETCKANQIDSTKYLTDVLDEMAQNPDNRKFEYLSDYLPWNWKRLQKRNG